MKRVLRLAGLVSAAVRTVVLFAAIASSSFLYDPTLAQGNQAALEIRAPGQVAVGEPIELTLTVKRAADIAGYETALLFDTGVVEFAGLQQRQNDIKKFGRDVTPLTVVDTPSGVAFGLYSCPTDDCLTPQHGTRTDKGARGNLKLATVTLIAKAPGTLEIRLDATKFVDGTGNPVDVVVANPTIIVQVGAPGEGPSYPAPGSMWPSPPATPASAALQPDLLDLTGDALVNDADAMEGAIEWVLARESLDPCGTTHDPTRDVNQDDCIDVSDLQILAAHSAAATTISVTSLTFTVNVISDGGDANIGNGTCATAYNVCTLRAAIQESNAHTGPDSIRFNIGGGGLRTIQLNWRLPTLSDTTGGTTIDGYTQPGATPNTDPLASNAVIRIQIAGHGEDRHDGFLITSSNNVIQGLAVYKMRRAVWISGRGAANNFLSGNFIGTDAAGSYGAPALVTSAHGVNIDSGANRNRIGGTELADRNVISGSAQSGVAIWHETSDGNMVQNNLIGMTPSGTARLPNRRHGVDINYSAEANIIGGTGTNQRDVLSGNDFSGIEVSHTAGTSLNSVVGNFIGTDVTGNSAPDWSYNGYTGVTLEDGVANNTVAHNVIGSNRQGGIQITGIATAGNQIYGNRVGIGLSGGHIGNSLFGIRTDGGQNTIGPGNIIAYSQYNGLVSRDTNADFNRITRNSIYSNGGLGIDLLPNGVTQNDPGDGDSGPNDNLNFPVLTSASSQQVTGTACPGCIVEIFIADSGAGAYGEGKTFVGSAAADASGGFTVGISGVVAGNYLTATATDGTGNTSEFSRNLLVQ